MKTFLCEESVLRHNKKNCFPSYLDHYLINSPAMMWSASFKKDPHALAFLYYYSMTNHSKDLATKPQTNY